METELRDMERFKFPKSISPYMRHFCQKIFCPNVALLETQLLTTHTISGLFIVCIPSRTRGQIVSIISNLMPLYLVCVLNDKVILNKAKHKAELPLFFEAFVQ